jgi:hypothetical protein
MPEPVEIKKKNSMKVTLEQLDSSFFIKDSVLKDGYVSEKILRQISYRIVEVFSWWNDYLHSIIMPNPQNMLNMSESKIFDSVEKSEITNLMKKVMEISSKNNLIALDYGEEKAANFIEESYDFWKKDFKPKIVKIMKKINDAWSKK